MLVILVGSLPACGGLTPAGEKVEKSRTERPESFLEELARRYEARNPAGFMDLVHHQYEDARGNRNDLRYRISRATDQYGRIEVDLYEDRTLQQSPRVLEVRWSLRWVCQATGPGCYRGDETMKRSGRSELILKRESGKWSLQGQRQDALFGDLQPGRGEE